MTEIAELLDPEVVARIKTVATLTPVEKAKKVIKSKGQPDIVVTKASTEPNPPRPLTRADAIVIPEGTTEPVEATCVDCGSQVWLSPTLPDGVDPRIPRVPICADDAEIRCTFAAVVEQRKVEIHQRQQQHTQPKEKPVIDLNTIPDAEVGKSVKDAIKAEKAKKIRKNQPKTRAKQVKAEQKAREARTAEQKNRTNLVLKGFTVDKSSTVPDLDLTQATLDELVHQKDRHSYNSARFRILGESALDPETTTWRVLAEEHVRLRRAAKARAEERAKAEAEATRKAARKAAKSKAPKKAKGKKVVAQVDEDERAKRIAAFVATVKVG